MTERISEGRKAAYYVGCGLIVVGVLSFASVFLTAAMHFGDFSHFASDARSNMLRAFGGMALIVVGGIIRVIGARGLAGSGAVLDPGRAREELEPYSRMAGGMVKDALDEADIHLSGRPERVIMIKCPSCGTLNEDGSKFCQECGKSLGPDRPA
jgi:hypothetical protein